MIKLLFFLFLGYVGYRAVRRWTQPESKRQSRVKRRASGEIDDIMVKDPQCQTYFPRREGLHANIDGDDYYFCSPRCRDAFLSRHERAKDQAEE
jgi:YHS domain-containing protein